MLDKIIDFFTKNHSSKNIYDEAKLPQKIFVIVCNKFGDGFKTEEEVRNAINRLATIRDFKECDFSFMKLDFLGVYQQKH